MVTFTLPRGGAASAEQGTPTHVKFGGVSAAILLRPHVSAHARDAFDGTKPAVHTGVHADPGATVAPSRHDVLAAFAIPVGALHTAIHTYSVRPAVRRR